MKQPLLPAMVVTVSLALALASCGDDSTDPGSAPATLPDIPVTDSIPAADPDSSDAYVHPTGADEVVFEYAELGGFVSPEFIFQRTPAILVSGDGRLFTPGPQIAIYPGPLLPSIQVRTISEIGIQQLLAAADEAGLFAPVDYSAELNIADAPVATVTIAVDGETWVHEAYALGLALPGSVGEVTPQRQVLADFLAAIETGGIVDEAELGPSEMFAANRYLIEANVVDDLSVYGDIEPTVLDWPVGASVRLADAASCVELPGAEVGDAFAAANQLSFFADGGVTYQVFAKPALPGTSCAG